STRLLPPVPTHPPVPTLRRTTGVDRRVAPALPVDGRDAWRHAGRPARDIATIGIAAPDGRRSGQRGQHARRDRSPPCLGGEPAPDAAGTTLRRAARAPGAGGRRVAVRPVRLRCGAGRSVAAYRSVRTYADGAVPPVRRGVREPVSGLRRGGRR